MNTRNKKIPHPQKPPETKPLGCTPPESEPAMVGEAAPCRPVAAQARPSHQARPPRPAAGAEPPINPAWGAFWATVRRLSDELDALEIGPSEGAGLVADGDPAVRPIPVAEATRREGPQ